MPEVSTEQSEDGRKHLKRLYEYTKKAMSFEALLLLALLNQHQQSLYHSNTAFKVSLAMLLVAFFTNLLTGVLLLNSFSFLPFFKYPTYISSIIQMLVPFGLLVSSGHLQPYMILVSPLPFFSIALFHRADTTTDDASSALDHIFDMSAGVYALLSAGCALTSPYFISSSRESVVSASSPLACSLFVTILTARYLMLISTLRPPVIIAHAGTLMLILKLLLALTVIFVAVEFLGWLRALFIIAVGGTDAALFFMFLLVHSNTPRKPDHQTSDHQQQRKDQQLLSAVLVSVLFTALTQTYSEHAAGGEEASPLGSAAVLRLLLHFGAFLWSLNRMIITVGLGDDVVAAPAPAAPEGGHAGHALLIRVWSALELIRASIVVVAALDMISSTS